METPKTESPRLPDTMQLKLHRMCGDHPSVTKTELNLNAKEDNKDEKDKEKKMSTSFAKISPTSSRADKPSFVPDARVRSSEHALRRRTHPSEYPLQAQRNEPDPSNANRALLQAALGSFRWPPYLVCVWVVVLLVSHALHCLVGVLERSLPTVRKFCEYFRTWTEESWRSESDTSRVCPCALACMTGLLYALYCGLYLLYSVALWAVEPLCVDVEEKQSTCEMPKITNYIDEIHSKTSASLKC